MVASYLENVFSVSNSMCFYNWQVRWERKLKSQPPYMNPKKEMADNQTHIYILGVPKIQANCKQ